MAAGNAVAFAAFGALFAALFGTIVVIAIIVALFGGANSPGCDSGDPADPASPSTGDLGGVSGTGISRGELEVVRSSRLAGTQFATGTFASTAYGPPWGGIQGQGLATAGGIRLNGGAPRKYLVATDARVISLGQWVSIWPNPFAWRGAFLAADTGGAIDGRRVDFYDWRGRSYQSTWSQPVQVTRPTSTPLGLGPNDLAADGLPLAPPSGAAEPTQTTTAPVAAAPGPLLHLGDSLAVGSAPALRRRLTSWTITDRAQRNRTSSQGVRILRRLTDIPSTLVVELGTNDSDVRTFRANVRSILTIARAASARVIWVNISRPPLPGTRTTDMSLNEVLRAEATRHDNLSVVDWNAAVENDLVNLADHVHPTGEGYEARARLIAAAVTADPGPKVAGGCDDDIMLSSDTGQRIGQIARRYLGDDGRRQPFRDFQPPQIDYAWCAWFITNVWRLAGVAIETNAFSGYLHAWGQQNDTLFKPVGAPPRGPTPPLGSALMYGTGPGSATTSQHVNLVDALNEDGTFMITSGNSDSSRVTRQGPCRLSVGDPATLTGPACDGRPIYAITAPEA